jgi:excisionase family DNA binding protein
VTSAYLSYAQAAEYLGLPSVNALKHRVKRGTVPAWCWTRMGGKSIRFIKSALDEWMVPADRVQVLREVHAPRLQERRGPRAYKAVVGGAR